MRVLRRSVPLYPWSAFLPFHGGQDPLEQVGPSTTLVQSRLELQSLLDDTEVQLEIVIRVAVQPLERMFGLLDFALSDEDPRGFRAEGENTEDKDREEPLKTDGDLVGCPCSHVTTSLDDDCREAAFGQHDIKLRDNGEKDPQLTNSDVKVDKTGSNSSELKWRDFDGVRGGGRGEDTGGHTIDDLAEEPHDILARNDEEFDKDG